MPGPSSAAVPAGSLLGRRTGHGTAGRGGRGTGRSQDRVLGVVTRGTTGTDRLRRVDRWVGGPGAPLLRAAADPLVVDLGFGASPTTTLETARALRAVRPDVEVVGLEVDPARVALARARVAALPGPVVRGVGFGEGGFELGGPAARRRPVVVRAANVLRQYDAADVPAAWEVVTRRLAPGGVLLDVTCDELGRVASWAVVGVDGPRALVVSLRLADLELPSVVAQRLPKALIHHNVPGSRVHAFVQALDDAWHRAAPLSTWGVRQRWLATCRTLLDDGWPVLSRAPHGGPRRWRLGELAVAWDAVAP